MGVLCAFCVRLVAVLRLFVGDYMSKKVSVKKKIIEIERLLLFLSVNDLKPRQLADMSGISERTILNTIWKNTEIGARLLRYLYVEMGVSIDWLLGGDTPMIRRGFEDMAVQVKEAAPDYGDVDPELPIPLVAEYEHFDESVLQDFWWLMAQAAEKSLIQAGGMPNEDYSLLDLYKLSQPFVLKRFSEDSLKL